jgi:transposase-like protein
MEKRTHSGTAPTVVCFRSRMQEMYASLSKTMKPVRPPCPVCGAIPWGCGYRVNLRGVVQKYQCRRCGTKFTRGAGYFRGDIHPAAVVMYAVLRYHTHPTLKQIQVELSRLGCRVSKPAIMEWVHRYNSHRRKLDRRLQNMPLSPGQCRRLRREIREAYR